MKIIQKSKYIFLIILLISCNNNIENKINGFWDISGAGIVLPNEQVVETSGAIIFEKEKCNLPTILFKDTSKYGSSGMIEEAFYNIVEVSPYKYKIFFNTKNKIYNGVHNLKFLKVYDKEKNFGVIIIIYSSKLYFECKKSHLFKKPESFYEEYEKLTKNSEQLPYYVNRLVE
jgi:hypothetical protein